MASIDFSLTDKVVLVTGAGKGIGKEIALACADAGADIVAGSRTVSEVEQVAEEVRKNGQTCRGVASRRCGRFKH